MPLEFTYSDPLGADEPAVETSLGSNTVRFATLSLANSAEVGEPATCGIEVDDPAAEWNFVGLRRFMTRETSAPSNNQIVHAGIIQDRAVYRADSMRTGSQRRWSIDLSDYNWQLSKRIHTDSDAKRPAESAGRRLRWLLNDAAHIWLFDYGNVTYPSHAMDANNYRGMRASDLIADCANPGGYNFWCDYNEAAQRPELFFMDPNSSTYQSTLAISNDLADVDSSTTFAPSIDGRLTRSASRIAFGVYAAYAKGAVYVTNATTGAQFNKVDQSLSLGTVKSLAKATTIAERHLADHDEESDRVTCTIVVPADKVNHVRHGHLIPVKFTHIPGYEDFVYCRVMRRIVNQVDAGGEAYFSIYLELVPTAVEDVSCPVSLSGGVVATLSDQAYALGLVTLPITPTTPSLVIGIAGACNHNTPGSSAMGATGAYTDIFADSVPAGTPTFAMIYRANVEAGATTATAAYTGGFSAETNSKWGGIVTAIATTATTPVQSKGTVSSTGAAAFVTLDSAPTPGNMLIMAMGDRSAIPDGPQANLYPPTGWTLLGTAQTWDDGTSKDCGMWLYARCVQAGDGTGPYGASQGDQQFCAVTEWAIS